MPRCPICVAVGQQRPGYARHLVGERHRHDLERPPRQQLGEPGIFPRISWARRNTECAPTMRMRRK
jgi:hypothetical protein